MRIRKLQPGLALALLSLVATALVASAQRPLQAPGIKQQQPAPFFSIKDGKTSARRIQQQQQQPMDSWLPTSTTTSTTASTTTLANAIIATTATTGAPASGTTSGAALDSLNLTLVANPDATLAGNPGADNSLGDNFQQQQRIGANSLADGQLEQQLQLTTNEPLMAGTGSPSTSTASGSEQTGGSGTASNQQSLSTPSSLSLSLDGMIVNSRPRPELPSSEKQTNTNNRKSLSQQQPRVTARTGELADAKASRRVPLQGQPLASPATKGQRNRVKPQVTQNNAPQQTGSSSMFGTQANDLVSANVNQQQQQAQNLMRSVKPSMPTANQQHDGFGEDQQQVRLAVNQQVQDSASGLGIDNSMIEPASLELMRNLIQQASAGRGGNQQATVGQLDLERPEDMVMSVMSSPDGKERRLVMIARDTLDSLQRYAQQQQMEATARQQQQRMPATKTAAPRQPAARRPQQQSQTQDSGWMNEPEVGSWIQQQMQMQMQTTTTSAPTSTTSTTATNSQQTSTAAVSATTTTTTVRPTAAATNQDESNEVPSLPSSSSGLRGAMADSFREVSVDQPSQVEAQTKRTNGQQVANMNASQQQQTRTQAAAFKTQQQTNGRQKVGSSSGQVEAANRWSQAKQQQQSGSGRSQSLPPPTTTTAATVAQSGPTKQSNGTSKRKNNGGAKVAAKQQANSGAKATAGNGKSSSGSGKKPSGVKKQQVARRPASELNTNTQNQKQQQQQQKPVEVSTSTNLPERSNQLDRQQDELERGAQQPPEGSSWSQGSSTGAGRTSVNEEGVASLQALGAANDERSQLEGLRASVPGEPQLDYPIYSQPPRTSFDCQAQSCPGGYYADLEAQCQVFHVCQSDGRRDSFLCPNGTIFSQQHFVCVWWWQVDCQQSPAFYKLNDAIYCNSMLPAAVTASAATAGSGIRQQQQLLSATNQALIPTVDSNNAGEAAGANSSTPLLDNQQLGRATPTLDDSSNSANQTSAQATDTAGDFVPGAAVGQLSPTLTAVTGNQQDTANGNALTSEAELNQQQQQQLELLARRA